ncbi:hypothetical protein EMIT0P4_400020 [Pseudomonas sp. IT-P4]
MGVKRRGGVFIIFKFTQKINEAPPFRCETIRWQLYAGSQTEPQPKTRQIRGSPTYNRHKT